MLDLNRDQAKSLSDFFFDLAKGLILGGAGFGLTVPNELKLLVVIFMSILSYWCVKTALSLLR